MAQPIALEPVRGPSARPVYWNGLPLLYEDEDPEMGESNIHCLSDEVLRIGLRAHFAGDSDLQVFSNMNLYYTEVEGTSRQPYVSPDDMVVRPFHHLPEDIQSYRIGRDGPAPLATLEVLSERSAEHRDLDEKAVLYARLGVAEYILVDMTGEYLEQRLLLKRLQPDGTYLDEQDDDGGVTSRLGFRLIIDADGKLRVMNAVTKKYYVRPDEAQAEADARQAADAAWHAEAAARQAEAAARQAEAAARQAAEARVRELEAENERLRQLLQERPPAN